MSIGILVYIWHCRFMPISPTLTPTPTPTPTPPGPLRIFLKLFPYFFNHFTKPPHSIANQTNVFNRYSEVGLKRVTHKYGERGMIVGGGWLVGSWGVGG
ncbi:hypothetical protein M0802_001872 [Mischocyttarus mexicanus]|nr:hypothetical protein M0802_001872 [Mischocyttarus mexicanus]